MVLLWILIMVIQAAYSILMYNKSRLIRLKILSWQLKHSSLNTIQVSIGTSQILAHLPLKKFILKINQFFLRITWRSIYQRIVILTNCTKLAVNFQWYSIYLNILVSTLHHVKNTLIYNNCVVIGVFMRMILISNRGKYTNHI